MEMSLFYKCAMYGECGPDKNRDDSEKSYKYPRSYNVHLKLTQESGLS